MLPEDSGSSYHRANTTSVSSFFTAISKLLTFGLTAATTKTGTLATGAASAASQYTVEPFNALVKSATRRYFAPSIVYPDYSLSWSTNGRKRSVTEDVIVARRGSKSSTVAAYPGSASIARRDSLAKAARWDNDLLNGGVIRSSSVPVLTALDVPDKERRRKPSLRPINTNIPYNGSSRRRSITHEAQLAAYSLLSERKGSMDQLSPPLLTTSSDGSSGHASAPTTPVSPRSSSKGPDPLRHSTPVVQKPVGKSLAIARVSFWNLVKLGEAEPRQEDPISIIGGKEDICEAMGIIEDGLAVAYEEEEENTEGADGGGESYKRLCYV